MIRTNPKVVGNWRLAHFPGPGFSDGQCLEPLLSQNTATILKKLRWIKAYSNPERAKEFMMEFGIGSPHRLTYEDEELLKQHAHDYPGQLDNPGRAKSLPWTLKPLKSSSATPEN